MVSIDLHHFPWRAILVHHRSLIELAVQPVESALPERRPQNRKVGSRCGRGRGGTTQRRLLRDGPVAIHAIDFDCIASFAIEFPVAVVVLLEMAIRAVHAFFEMDVLKVDSFLELVLIGIGDDAILAIQ